MSKSGKSHTIDVIFVLAIACAFAASILMVLMLGVNVYGHIQDTSNSEFNKRVCLSYITAKVHSNDSYGEVTAGVFGDVPALFLEEEFDGVKYNTIIYTYDGWLRELFCERDNSLSPDSGTPVLEIDSVSFEKVKPNLLSVEYSDVDGGGGKIFISLRSEGGGVT